MYFLVYILDSFHCTTAIPSFPSYDNTIQTPYFIYVSSERFFTSFKEQQLSHPMQTLSKPCFLYVPRRFFLAPFIAPHLSHPMPTLQKPCFIYVSSERFFTPFIAPKLSHPMLTLQKPCFIYVSSERFFTPFIAPQLPKFLRSLITVMNTTNEARKWEMEKMKQLNNNNNNKSQSNASHRTAFQQKCAFDGMEQIFFFLCTTMYQFPKDEKEVKLFCRR
jgi:hypothetical protein